MVVLICASPGSLSAILLPPLKREARFRGVRVAREARATEALSFFKIWGGVIHDGLWPYKKKVSASKEKDKKERKRKEKTARFLLRVGNGRKCGHSPSPARFGGAGGVGVRR